MASSERLELPTDGLEGRCSILLSYEDSFISKDILTLIKIKVNLFSTEKYANKCLKKYLTYAIIFYVRGDLCE